MDVSCRGICVRHAIPGGRGCRCPVCGAAAPAAVTPAPSPARRAGRGAGATAGEGAGTTMATGHGPRFPRTIVLMRNVAVLVLVAALSASAAPPGKKAPASVAPDTVPHDIAMFLGSLCNGGGRQVTFKARA